MSIRVAGRPFVAVQADLVDGLVATNELVGDRAQELRRSVWSALDQAGQLDGGASLVAA